MMLSSQTTGQYTVPGKNLKVSLSLDLVRKDLSGQTSNSSSVTAGNKPKKISVALTLGFSEAAKLRKLTAIAEALDKSGDPEIYTIADDTCEAMNIRQVRFCDTFRVTESDRLRAWDITFSMQEYKSVSEKKESRTKSNEIKAKTADGKEIKQGSSSKDSYEKPKATPSSFEKILQTVENVLPDI